MPTARCAEHARPWRTSTRCCRCWKNTATSARSSAIGKAAPAARPVSFTKSTRTVDGQTTMNHDGNSVHSVHCVHCPERGRTMPPTALFTGWIRLPGQLWQAVVTASTEDEAWCLLRQHVDRLDAKMIDTFIGPA